MCGISGYFSSRSDVESAAIIRRMNSVLAHRGPDDEGLLLIRPQSGDRLDLKTENSAADVPDAVEVGGASWPHRIAFGHRRFSIVDLSPGGHQPFWSSDESVCVCFNGELYNYVELRYELESLGHRFRTTSDTEVLAESFVRWGTSAFERFVGWWALALYDARTRRVLIARDRLGQAPLYVSNTGSTLWWSSEIKGLIAGMGQDVMNVRDQAVSDFVIRGWRDVYERTFFESVDTFPSASWSWVSPDGTMSPTTYWSKPRKRMDEAVISPEEAAEGLRSRLAESMRVRLRADVPVGFELSGGLDSSSLLAVSADRGHDIRAFTVAFQGGEDEEPFAHAVAKRYAARTEYNIVEHRVEDFFDSADEIVHLMDEPFHSPNILSIQRIWQVMKSQGIRVTIKGDAGDELFAGYPGVYYNEYLWDLIERGDLRTFHREATMFSENPVEAWTGAYARRVAEAGVAGLRKHGGATRHAIANLRKMRSGRAAGLRVAAPPQWAQSGSIQEILLHRMGDWQLNYWLRAGNAASMGIPIEIRTPFLDHRVVEFVMELPVSFLIRDGWLKWILRKSMKDYLPEEVVWRTQKMGFPFPYRRWLGQSKKRFFAALGGTDVPYLDLGVLRDQYDRLVVEDPLLLWRMMVTALWWRRCIEGESLAS